jgi:serine-threonine kinase receptor-associated protein
VFVCAGDDFKVYKFNFHTGEEIESFKGHFGPVHTIVFSPDGELYASGSEDGTVRLWQTTVGKTYGLWRVMMAENDADAQNNATPREIAAN